MPELNLSEREELHGLELIQNREGIDSFLATLWQEEYSPDQLAGGAFDPENLEQYLEGQPEGVRTFYAYRDRQIHFKRQELYRCAAIRHESGTVYIVKELIMNFLTEPVE